MRLTNSATGGRTSLLIDGLAMTVGYPGQPYRGKDPRRCSSMTTLRVSTTFHAQPALLTRALTMQRPRRMPPAERARGTSPAAAGPVNESRGERTTSP